MSLKAKNFMIELVEISDYHGKMYPCPNSRIILAPEHLTSQLETTQNKIQGSKKCVNVSF